MRLKLWRDNKSNDLLLDNTPTGVEEEENLFENPVGDPRELNAQILRERMQDMNERVLYADRSFLVTLVWVGFLVLLTAAQLALSWWERGLSDWQFVTVVTTTTASVFGFMLLVGRYLHRKKPPTDS